MRVLCRIQMLPAPVKLVLGTVLILVGLPVFLLPIPLGLLILLAGILMILSAFRREGALKAIMRRRFPGLYRRWRIHSTSCDSDNEAQDPPATP